MYNLTLFIRKNCIFYNQDNSEKLCIKGKYEGVYNYLHIFADNCEIINMDNKGFTYRKRLESFKYAFNGIRLLLCNEHNAWLHCFIGICAVIAGFLLDISAMEWITIAIVCGCVFAAEAFNTAIEQLSNVVSPEYNESIKKVKDLSAAGVLFMAIAAAITGVIIFMPEILVVLFMNYWHAY